MARILSGQFDDFEAARAVVEELLTLGVSDEDLETYALNAPGQHALFPIGGDEDADGIEEAEGTWHDGSWSDFDPVTVPRWIEAPRTE